MNYQTENYKHDIRLPRHFRYYHFGLFLQRKYALERCLSLKNLFDISLIRNSEYYKIAFILGFQSHCPPGYTDGVTGCFKVILSDVVNFTSAKVICESLGFVVNGTPWRSQLAEQRDGITYAFLHGMVNGMQCSKHR